MTGRRTGPLRPLLRAGGMRPVDGLGGNIGAEIRGVDLRELEAQYPNPWHPVVRVHPVTGPRIVDVNPQFCVRIKGLEDDESRMTLDDLYSRATIPEYPLRVKWAPHAMVMWDNRSVHHYVPHDYFPQRRTMERVTVAGEPVVGVSDEYVPQEGVAPLPSGHGVVPANPGRRPIREFERG